MNDQECRALITIIDHDSIESLDDFLQHHPDALRTPLNQQGQFAIHYAARQGLTHKVSFICDRQPDSIYFKDNYEQTALIAALFNGKMETIEFLIAKGSDLNAQSIDPKNPDRKCSVLGWAQELGHQKCINLIKQIKNSIAAKALSLAINDETQKASITYQSMKEAVADRNDKVIYFFLQRSHCFHKMEIDKKLELLTLLSEYGDTDILKSFLNLQLWPTESPPDGFNMLQWAVVNGLIPLVEILLEQGADIKQTLNNPQHPYHDMDLIDVAFHCNHDDLVNLLIAKLLQDSNPDNLDKLVYKLLYITSGKQALDLMAQSPHLMSFLMNNEGIRSMVNTTLANKSPSATPHAYYPRTLTRKNSFYATNSRRHLSLFKPQSIIGKGKYGSVRLFINQIGEKIAVKSFGYSSQEQITREGQIFAHVYPDLSHPASTFFNSNREQGREVRTERLVMPYFQPAYIYFGLMSVLDIAKHIQLVAQELLRIHHAGIVHGDINSGNVIFCIDGSVKFIDFGFSYYIKDRFAIVFPPDIYPPLPCIIAPERYCARDTLAPDPSQDIYSLGWLIDNYIDRCSSDCQTGLTVFFDSISNFLIGSIETEPHKRPKLDEFCSQLQDEITRYESLHPEESAGNQAASSYSYGSGCSSGLR